MYKDLQFTSIWVDCFRKRGKIDKKENFKKLHKHASRFATMIIPFVATPI